MMSDVRLPDDEDQSRARAAATRADSNDEPAAVRPRRKARHASQPAGNRVSSWILFIAIAGAPLPFGSRDAITVAFWCLLLGVGLIFASPRQLRGPQLALLAGVGGVVAAFGLVLHEQLSAHPWIAAPNPIWAKASEALGRPLPPSVSIVRDEPFYALGPSLAAVLSLVLGLVVGAERARARQAVQVMAWAGAAYAVYGLLTVFIEPTGILLQKTSMLGSVTGTFINRNTAAAYFGSVAAVWLVLLMASARGRLPRGPIVWRKALGTILTDTPLELAVRFALLFVCLAALFMTASRAGVTVSLLVMVIAFVLFFGRDLPRGRGLVMSLLIAGAFMLALLQIMGGSFNERFDAQGFVEQGRFAAYRSTLRLIADYPWFGTGLGTFPAAFPPYRSHDISMYLVWDRAHSTPLELAAELGVPLAVVIALAWLVALVVLANALRGSRRNAVVPLAALAVALIALLHSAVDFSLQVTGYTIVVFALVGVGLSQGLAPADDVRAPTLRG